MKARPASVQREGLPGTASRSYNASLPHVRPGSSSFAGTNRTNRRRWSAVHAHTGQEVVFIGGQATGPQPRPLRVRVRTQHVTYSVPITGDKLEPSVPRLTLTRASLVRITGRACMFDIGQIAVKGEDNTKRR
ncbi:hypothetical protein ACCO45_000907 [Purpureocillium lilacinum]|uniref:Uncharacterized protein n=1 Tax=Purpureocillium lilacinum TaxID=33203 RepID=A0ACC4E6Q3_PURLI